LDEIDSLRILGILSTLFLAAVFSMAELLLYRLSKGEIIDVAEAGGGEYEILHSLLRAPQRYHATIAIIKSLCLLGGFVLSLHFFSAQPEIVAVAVASLVLALFTELIPKNYIRSTNVESAIRMLYFLRPIYWLLFPIVMPMIFLSRLGIRILGGSSSAANDSLVSSESLETFVSIGDRQEILDQDEREMISRILDLPDKVAREIMIPRTDMVRIDATTLADEVLQIAIQSRHSRIPVYQGRVDHIIGILHVKELLDCWAEKKPIELEKLVASRPPFFTPESRKIWDLFQDLQANKQHLAIVVDEYGGTAGIVTLEDIIEEIVGEIQDEYDTDDEVECIQLSEQTYSVDARMHIDDFNDIFQTELKVESVDTIGGVMIDHFGKVPEKDDFFVHLGLKISILDADDRRVYRVRVDKP
jgi:putative hemolysin